MQNVEGDEFEITWQNHDPQELGVISKKTMFKFVLDFLELTVYYRDLPLLAIDYVDSIILNVTKK